MAAMHRRNFWLEEWHGLMDAKRRIVRGVFGSASLHQKVGQASFSLCFRAKAKPDIAVKKLLGCACSVLSFISSCQVILEHC